MRRSFRSSRLCFLQFESHSGILVRDITPPPAPDAGDFHSQRQERLDLPPQSVILSVRSSRDVLSRPAPFIRTEMTFTTRFARRPDTVAPRDRSKMKKFEMCFALVLLAASGVWANDGSSSAPQNQSSFEVTMVARTITVINYQHRGGSTDIGFQGSPIMPSGKGTGKVESKQGRIQINANF